MTNDQLLSSTISYLRFPLTVGVVFIHFNLSIGGLSLHGIKYGIDNPDWYHWIIRFCSEVIPTIGVPLFFFFSGFLFFYNKDFNCNVYKQKLRTRIKTLLVPYLLWNFIAILIHLFFMMPFLSSVFPNFSMTEIHLTPERLFNTFFSYFPNEGIFLSPTIESLGVVTKDPGPIDLPLWYVRDLMLMILLSPMIWWLIKKTKIWVVATLGIMWYFYKPVFAPNGGWLTLLCTAAFFFSWGGYFSINKINFVKTFRKYRYIPRIYIAIALIDTLTRRNDYNLYIHNIGIIIGIISLITIVSYLIENGKVKVNNTLANCSFFIYALHSLIIWEIGKLIFVFLHFPDNSYIMLSLYFVVPILTSSICIILYIMLKCYTPSFCNMLTGGR